MYQKITELSNSRKEVSIERRRDFHRNPETAWLEMRTSAVIAGILDQLGYEVLTGKAVCAPAGRIGIPPADVLQKHAERVTRQGTASQYLTEEMKEGYTGVIGILRCGEGPVVGLRFDIDALGLTEQSGEEHRPFREGFSSVQEGSMHACGHDGHAAIGLGVAEVLMQIKKTLHGTVKLIFQPAEEGTKGARAIVECGHLDDVDFFVGAHISPDDGEDDGDVTPGSYGSLATTKYDVYFRGRPAHAGGVPEQGISAIIAASNAVLNLTAIPRHSEGASRVNVGSIHGGTGRNVVPEEAMIQMEVRGETTKINQYMEDCAKRVCHGAAAMNGCTCEMVVMGSAQSLQSDEDFLNEIGQMIRDHLPNLTVSTHECSKNKGSEDISLMMARVQAHGGKATFMRTVTAMTSPQHTTGFDFEESVLTKGIETFSAIVYHLLGS